MSDVENRFLRALPMGDWSGVEVIDVPGMMSSRAIQANATCEKVGGLPARLKCFIVRSDSAGPESRRLVGRDRLERLERRLARAMNQQPSALVQLFHVGFMDGFEGLLIAMERVTPLKGLIERNELVPRDAADLLDQLGHSRIGWIHFDICPANAARDASDRFVFIDPDSYYQLETEFVDITFPALKPRLPRIFLDRVREGLGAQGRMANELAGQKHDAELVLLAAECCLGPQEVAPLTLDYVDEWVRESQYGPRVTTPIRDALTAMCSGEAPDVTRIASLLRRGTDSSDSAGKRGTRPKRPMVADVDAKSWEALEGARRALRAERLRGDDLRLYRETVLALARKAKHDRRLWEEAVVIVLGYERDADLALAVLEEALVLFPEDPRFAADRRLVLVCRGSQ